MLLTKAYLGSTEIQKAYLGSTLVFDNTGGGTLPLSNIVSEYKFEDNVLDTVGTNDGTPTDMTYGTGMVSKYGIFNGSSSYVDCGLGLNPTFESDFSISMLIKRETTTKQFLCSTEGSVGVRGFQFKLENNEINFTLVTGGVVVFRFPLIFTTDITHVVFTYNRVDFSLSKMYINGVDITLISVTGTNTGMIGIEYPFLIGVNGRGLINYFDGGVDVLKVWDKELNQTEVTELSTQELAGTDVNP